MPRFTQKSIIAPTLLIIIVGVPIYFCPLSNTLLVRPILAQFDSHFTSGPVATIPFNRNLWREGKARHRVGMANFLVENKLLEGKTRTELVEMLGDPDMDKSGEEGTRWVLGYHAKGLFDETIWLELTIDNDGKASSAIVSKDWYNPRAH